VGASWSNFPRAPPSSHSSATGAVRIRKRSSASAYTSVRAGLGRLTGIYTPHFSRITLISPARLWTLGQRELPLPLFNAARWMSRRSTKLPARRPLWWRRPWGRTRIMAAPPQTGLSRPLRLLEAGILEKGETRPRPYRVPRMRASKLARLQQTTLAPLSHSNRAISPLTQGTKARRKGAHLGDARARPRNSHFSQGLALLKAESALNPARD